MLELTYTSQTAQFPNVLEPYLQPLRRYNTYLQEPPRVYYEEVDRIIGLWASAKSPTFNAPARYYLYAIMKTYFWPSWGLRLWEFDAGSGELLSTVEKTRVFPNLPMVFLSAKHISSSPQGGQYLYTPVALDSPRIYALDPFSYDVTDLGPDDAGWRTDRFHSTTATFAGLQAFGFDPGTDYAILAGTLQGAFSYINEVGVFKISTGDYLYKIPVAGRPKFITAESFGHCYCVAGSGVVTLVDYLQRKVMGTFKVTKGDYPFLVAYDPTFKRVLVVEETPNAEDGGSTIRIKGYRSVPQAVGITQPIPDGKIRVGKQSRVIVRAYGDSAEPIPSVPVTLTGGGVQILKPTAITDPFGYAIFPVRGTAQGATTLTATADLPEPDVQVAFTTGSGGSLATQVSTNVDRIVPNESIVNQLGTTEWASYITDSAYGRNAPWNISARELPTHPNSSAMVGALLDEMASMRTWMSLKKTGPDIRYAQDATELVSVVNSVGNANGRKMPWNPAWLNILGFIPHRLVIFDNSAGIEWDVGGGTVVNGVVHQASFVWAIPQDYRYIDVTSENPHFEDGLPFGACIITAKELRAAVDRRNMGEQHIGRSHIPHAICFKTRYSRPPVYPATRAPFDYGGPPMGSRFVLNMDEDQLDAWVEQFVAKWQPPPEEIVALKCIGYTLRDYGMMVRGVGINEIILENDNSGEAIYEDVGFQDQLLVWDRPEPLSDRNRISPFFMLEGLFTRDNLRAVVSPQQV